MRRQIAMALGGLLAVSAVGPAQQLVPVLQPKKVETPRYQSPFAMTVAKTDGTEVLEAVEVAPRTAQPVVAVPMLPPPNIQYTPVQPVQTYTASQPATPAAGPIHYIPVQPAPGPNLVAPAARPVMMSAPTQTQYIAQQPEAQRPQIVNPVQARPVQPAAQGQPAQAQPTTITTVAGCNNCNQPTCQECPPCQQTCCQPCGPDGRVWVSAEYLMWWTRGLGLPALVTGSPAGTPREQAGVIGAPGTRILYGDDQVNNELRSGFRLRVGGWLDCCRTCGVDGSYFFLGDQGETFTADCNTSLILSRPILNVSPNSNNNAAGIPIPDSELVCFPNVVDGRVTVNSNTGFTGFDANFRRNWNCDCNSRIDWIAGFRYLQLNDDLSIHEDLTVIATDAGGALVPGTRFQILDSFQTKNEFWGAQVGLTGEIRRCSGVFVSWRALIGLGTTHKQATINGATTVTQPGGAATTAPGGLLALPTNIGSYSKNDFSVVPEFNVNLGYQFSSNVRVFAGYTFLYWSNVTRAGDIIDPVINTSQLPPGTLVGPARPVFSWQDTDFWAQGFNFGAELRY